MLFCVWYVHDIVVIIIVTVHFAIIACIYIGGITTLAIDREALDEYSRATDSDANLDEFMARMTRDVIPDEVRQRCNVEVTHVRNSTEVSTKLANTVLTYLIFSLSLSPSLPPLPHADKHRSQADGQRSKC